MYKQPAESVLFHVARNKLMINLQEMEINVIENYVCFNFN